MTLQAPVVAILWESWRVTRAEVAWRFAGGLVAALAVLALSTAVLPSSEAVESGSAAAALAILVVPNLTGWMSFMALNGGRPGFPLHLLFARPVRTAVLVGVPMAYRTVTPAAIYLVSALLLRGTFGHPFPLLPVAAWIAVLHVLLTTLTWSTRNRVVHILGVIAVTQVWVALRPDPPGEIDWFESTSVWPTLFHISPAGYALLGVIGLFLYGVTVAAVARRRHGDGRASIPWSGVGFPDSFISLSRFPCPVSSATRAQVWFDLKSSGLPVLSIGLALAMLNQLLFAISIPAAWLRPYAILCALLSGPVVLFLAGNAFGIRRKQGRTYVSVFEATQPMGAAQLAALKVLLRTACVLAALVAIGVSVWASTSLVSAWGAWVDADGNAIGPQLVRARRAIGDVIAGQSGYAYAALAVVVSIAVALLVASRAVFTALRARYSRRVNMTVSLLLLYVLALILLLVNVERGFGFRPETMLGILKATRWIAAAAVASITGYLFWRSLAERILTLRQACGVVLVSAALATAWATVLDAADVQLATMPTADVLWILSPAVLPLMASVLAPWSLNRIRHT